MQLIRETPPRAGTAADLPAPPLVARTSALFLDFDGTLAEIAPRPDAVSIPDDLPSLLSVLKMELQGAVAVLTGRPLSVIDSLLAPLRLPGAGLHGAELRAGRLERPLADPRCASVSALGRRLRALFSEDPRIVVEDKLAGVALHFRQAPERQLECIIAAETLSSDYGGELELIRGKMVIEARLSGIDKGKALQVLMQQPPFHQRNPIVLGDDATDEEAFAAVQALGGVAVKVGGGLTVANYRLHAVEDVHCWLQASVNGIHDP